MFMGVTIDLDGQGWIIATPESRDKPTNQLYVSSAYWASVTITTVGYGDITPTNNDEVLFVVIMIALGSIFYSIFISVVANFFGTLEQVSIKINTYVKSIEYYRDLYNIPDSLIFEIRNYFSKHIKENIITKKVHFDDILKTFPKTLRLEVLMYVYKEAIQKVKFLRGRDSQFYANILPKLKPIKVRRGEVVLRQGTRATECFIVVSGSVVNVLSKRKFGEGSIFGITDIVYKRKRMENFIAESDSSLLAFERPDLENLLQEFPDINEEAHLLAQGRDELLQAVMRDKKRLEDARK